MPGHEKDFRAFALMYLSERQAQEQRDRARQDTERRLKEEEERFLQEIPEEQENKDKPAIEKDGTQNKTSSKNSKTDK